MKLDHDAAALGRAFDQRFAAREAPDARRTEDLVLARAGATPVGLRLTEIAGLYDAARVVRAPGGAPGFVGLAGVRGRVVPVFDLASLLGSGAADAAPRPLLAIAAGADRVGLLVSRPIGYVELPHPEGDEAGDTLGAQPFVRRLARAAGALVAVVDVPAVVREIAARSGGAT